MDTESSGNVINNLRYLSLRFDRHRSSRMGSLGLRGCDTGSQFNGGCLLCSKRQQKR
jgi:hypothetical protein